MSKFNSQNKTSNVDIKKIEDACNGLANAFSNFCKACELFLKSPEGLAFKDEINKLKNVQTVRKK
jgi:hypothetical protein